LLPSRVENGPNPKNRALARNALAKIAESHGHFAGDFFPGTEKRQRDRETQKALWELSQDEIRFLAENQDVQHTLSDGDKRGAAIDPQERATLLTPHCGEKIDYPPVPPRNRALRRLASINYRCPEAKR